MTLTYVPPRPLPSATTLVVPRSAIAILLVCAAALVRFAGLGARGFSEDEVNKWNAVAAYRSGNFSENAEHPMAMKLAAWASVSAASWWNARVGPGPLHVEPETALRAPNALAGTATAGLLFMLGEALFSTPVGVWAACIWALDPNAAAINRLAKEDTFLLFFFLLGAWLYEQGRRFHPASGIAFGLMLASKYMPHYFGLHVLFAFTVRARRAWNTAARGWTFYAPMAVAFVAANATILRPSTWAYLWAFVHGRTVHHTGYLFADQLYVNGLESSPWGLPPWFYLTYLVTKVPIVVLAAATAGLVWTWRHADHRGAVFVRIFLVFTLLPYSLVSGKFVRYMLPVLAVLDMAAAVGIVAMLKRTAAVPPAAALLLVTLVAGAVSASPDYSLAQNAIGAALAPPGSLFPDDEFYDSGVREAVAVAAGAAAPDAVVCSDAPRVVSEYLRRYGRPDIRSCSLSRDGTPMTTVDLWVIAQPGHIYFENALTLEAIRARLAPAAEFRVAGVSAAVLYHLARVTP
jgi:hypothetical protein